MDAMRNAADATRSREAEAFLDALNGLPMNAVTACRGWSTHDIVAHLTAGADALADQAEAFLAGAPVQPFGSWANRDARFRAVDPAQAVAVFESAEVRMSKALGRAMARDPHAAIPGGGWGFSVSHLVTHMRQEFALHRWDLLGDDQLGDELLAQPELVEHSVTHMDQWLLARGLAGRDSAANNLRFWLRCDGQPDVLVEAARGAGRMRFQPCPQSAAETMSVQCDPASRLLLLWGRHAAGARRTVSRLDGDALQQLAQLLQGF